MSCEISYVIGLAASVDEDAAKEAKHELRIKEQSIMMQQASVLLLEKGRDKLKDEIAGLKKVIARTKVSKEKPFWHCSVCKKWSSGYHMCGHCRVRIMDMDPKPEGAP